MEKNIFDRAIEHAMMYEVGSFFKVTPEVEEGLINTPAQKKAVGYVNDPLDRGGETKFGVSKNANPDINITTLNWADAKKIYFNRYWLPSHCHELTSKLSILHFDSAVNHGVVRANRFLQEASNVKSDGIIGNITLDAIRKLNEVDLCDKICSLREEFYKEITERKPDQKKFLKGWLTRITETHIFLKNLDLR